MEVAAAAQVPVRSMARPVRIAVSGDRTFLLQGMGTGVDEFRSHDSRPGPWFSGLLRPPTRMKLPDPISTPELAKGAGDSAAAALADVIARVQREIEALSSAAAAHDAHTASMRMQHAELARASEGLSAQQREVDEQKAGLERARAEARSREQALIDLEKELTAREHALAEQSGATETERAALDEQARTAEARRRVLDEQELRLREQAETLARRSVDLERRAAETGKGESALREEIAKRDQAVALLQQRLEEAREQTGRLEGELRRMREAPPPTPATTTAEPEPEFAMRRERLRRQRELLQARSAKLKQASTLLAKRSGASHKSAADTEAFDQQREMLEHQRKKLEQDRESLEQQRRSLGEIAQRVQNLHQTRTAHASRPSRVWRNLGAGALTTAFAMAVACAAAWPLAGLFAQPIVLAETRLGMEKSASESPTAEHIESWDSYLRALTTDPMLLEQAADRLKRRGFAEVGDPADLARRIEHDMTSQAAKPGELSLTLRGEGAMRTQRILETLTGVLVARANDARDRRLDKALTVVVMPARADSTPIEDARIPLFGLLAGALGVVCVIAGLMAALMIARQDRRARAVPAAASDEALWTKTA